MKIPTIPRVETGLTREIGAQPLNVQVSGEAMGAPGKALAQMGKTITDASLDWMGKELKMRRASEVAAAKKHLALKSEEYSDFVKAIPDSKRANRAYQTLIKKELQLINSGGVDGISFSDGAAKRTFGIEASTIIGSAGLKVRTNARKLMAAEFVSSSLRTADTTAE